MKKKSVRMIAQYGCMLAFAMIVSYVEAILPFHIGVPGAKLGLANFAIVYCIYTFGVGPALLLNLSRIILMGLLFGNPYSMLYSFAGAVFSFIAMVLIKRCRAFSMIGVSIAGGVMHNVGQVLMAYIITKVVFLFYYLPVLLVLGAVTGFANGLLSHYIYKKTKHIISE